MSAWLFVVLIVLPFTTPFSSCDVSDLLQQTAVATSRAIHADGPMTSITASTDVSVGGSFLDEERFKAIVTAALSPTASASAVSPVPTVRRGSAPRRPPIVLRL